jgi:hypothetical protein
MEGGSRVFPRFVRVGWALLISGLGIAVIGALYSGAAPPIEPIWHIIEHFGLSQVFILSVIPVVTYSNAKIEEKLAKSENRKRCGVYR